MATELLITHHGLKAAIGATVASKLVYNLVAIPPTLEFSIPSGTEIIYVLINVAVAIMVHLLVGEDRRKTLLTPKLALA